MREITGILLAAGKSSRFGSAKLISPLADGIPLGIASAKVMLQQLNTLAVVRADDRVLLEAYESLGLQCVINSDADEGMASSIVAGIKAAKHSDGWIIALADMPWLQPATIGYLKELLITGASMVAPVYNGRRGNPVGFSAKWRNLLLELQGEQGARQLLTDHADQLQLVDTDDAGVLMDVDRPADLPGYRA